MSASAACTYTQHVEALVREKIPSAFHPGGDCGNVPQVIWTTAALNSHGDPVPPLVAASRLIGILGHTRTITGGPGNQSGGPGNQSEPLGELVNVNVELSGLRGQPVLLSWSIFQEGGQSNLFGKWLSDFVAYRLEATTNDDTGALEMWIPLPKQHGPYFIRLTLTTGGASLASMNSGPFG
jgi:hypothetical protein